MLRYLLVILIDFAWGWFIFRTFWPVVTYWGKKRVALSVLTTFTILGSEMLLLMATLSLLEWRVGSLGLLHLFPFMLGAMIGSVNSVQATNRKELLILSILDQNSEPMYGLDIIGQSKGRLKRGTIYVRLQELEDAGYVSSKPECKTNADLIPRRLYSMTESGKQRLAMLRNMQKAIP